jgi:hypothetical protein
LYRHLPLLYSGTAIILSTSLLTECLQFNDLRLLTARDRSSHPQPHTAC